MTQSKISTKWIEYSDDQSDVDCSDSDKSKEKNKEKSLPKPKQTHTEQLSLKTKLSQQPIAQQTKDLGEYFWLLVQVSQEKRRQQTQLIFNLKNQDLHARVYFTNKKSNKNDPFFDVYVSRERAQKLLTQGIEGQPDIRVTIHKRNYEDNYRPEFHEDRRNQQHRKGRDNRGRRDRGQYRDNRGQRKNWEQRNNRDDRQPKKKPVYVDKQTGKESENKKLLEQRIMTEKQRQYTKKQAKRQGQALSNFRNKPLEQRMKEKEEKNNDLEEKKKIQSVEEEGKKPKDQWQYKEKNEDKEKEFRQTKTRNENQNGKKNKKKYILKKEEDKVEKPTEKKDINIKNKNPYEMMMSEDESDS